MKIFNREKTDEKTMGIIHSIGKAIEEVITIDKEERGFKFILLGGNISENATEIKLIMCTNIEDNDITAISILGFGADLYADIVEQLPINRDNTNETKH